MSLFTSWFRNNRNKPQNYESILQDLELEIDHCQTRLSEIRLRQRRSTLQVTLYTFLVWTVYLLLWYTNSLPAFHSLAISLPVFLGPLIILFARRIVQLWYSRKGTSEQKHLKALLTKQRTTIEDIKAKTNYYSTKSLLDRYDDQSVKARSTPQTPIRRKSAVPLAPATPSSAPLPIPLSPVQHPITPPRRQWYDRLVDAVLGEDDPAFQSHSRYALICQSCFAHNGLVRESEWETTQHRCPKCNHLNLSPVHKKQQQQQQSPQSASLKLPDLPHTPTPSFELPHQDEDAPVSMDVDNSADS